MRGICFNSTCQGMYLRVNSNTTLFISYCIYSLYSLNRAYLKKVCFCGGPFWWRPLGTCPVCPVLNPALDKCLLLYYHHPLWKLLFRRHVVLCQTCCAQELWATIQGHHQVVVKWIWLTLSYTYSSLTRWYQ